MSLPYPGADMGTSCGYLPNASSALQSTCNVSNQATSGQGRIVRGPYVARHVPVSGDVVVKPVQFGGQMVSVEEVWHLPLQSGARARSVIRDLIRNVALTVLDARIYNTYIECMCKRGTADT